MILLIEKSHFGAVLVYLEAGCVEFKEQHVIFFFLSDDFTILRHGFILF